jgi:hypothetical protein
MLSFFWNSGTDSLNQTFNSLKIICITSYYSWRQVKYTPLGPLGGFIEAEKLLERIKPEAEVYS